MLLLECGHLRVYDLMQAWAQTLQSGLLLDTHPGRLCYAATGRLPAQHTNIILLHLDLTGSYREQLDGQWDFKIVDLCQYKHLKTVPAGTIMICSI